jgi:CubicO group peptidase (beta-lactamase class C family)
MTAGLSWEESDVSFVPWLASADWSRFPLEQPLDAAPGTVFTYNTGLTHVASKILSDVVGQPLPEYARASLFDPAGMRLVRWDRDPSGTHLGGAEMYVVPRDLARFGELFLRNGTIDGTPILSEAAVENTTTELIPPGAVDTTNGYAAWWWTRSFAGHPTFFAWGHGGTFVFVIRDLDAVVVVTSNPDVGYADSGSNSSAVFALLEERIVPAIAP